MAVSAKKRESSTVAMELSTAKHSEIQTFMWNEIHVWLNKNLATGEVKIFSGQDSNNTTVVLTNPLF